MKNQSLSLSCLSYPALLAAAALLTTSPVWSQPPPRLSVPTPSAHPGSADATLQPATAPTDPASLLQQALFAEEATRDLTAAATGYEALLAQWTKQRQLAATALYRLAEVRRKQDRSADAIQLYQRFLTEFPDIDPQARLSRENLAALGAPAPPPGSSPAHETANPMSPEEEQELNRLKISLANGPDRYLEGVTLDDKRGENPLFPPLSKAAFKGWKQVMIWLLDHGSDPNHVLYAGQVAPLWLAATNGHTMLCEILLSRGAKIESAGDALSTVIGMNYRQTAELLFDKGIDLNAGFPLIAAVGAGNKEWVDRLLAKGVDVNKVRNWSALHVASLKGITAIVQSLLSHGADPNQLDTFAGSKLNPQTPFQRTIQLAKGCTPLHYAIGQPEIIQLLLKAGAKVDLADEKGCRPLHVACLLGETASAKVLLVAGADPNAPAPYNSIDRRQNEAAKTPPLLLAIAAEWEIQAGSGPQAGSPNFSTFMSRRIIPIDYNSTELVRLLLEGGAKADGVDANGWNAFHAMAFSPAFHEELAAVLLKAGAPLDKPEERGGTPLLIAIIRENEATGAPKNSNPIATQPEVAISAAAKVDFFLKQGADPTRIVDSRPIYESAVGARGFQLLREFGYHQLLIAAPASVLINRIPEGRLDYYSPKSDTKAADVEESPAAPQWADLISTFASMLKDREINSDELGNLSLWRKSESGSFTEIPLGTDPQSLPALRWGDVLEVADFTKGRRSYAPRERNIPPLPPVESRPPRAAVIEDSR